MTLDNKVNDWKEIKRLLSRISAYQYVQRTASAKAAEHIERYNMMRRVYETKYGRFKFDEEPSERGR